MNSSVQWIGFAVSLLVLAVGIYAAVIASQYDDAKWSQVGQNKMLFVIGCPLGGFCCWPVGLALTLWFLLGIKPKLDAFG